MWKKLKNPWDPKSHKIIPINKLPMKRYLFILLAMVITMTAANARRTFKSEVLFDVTGPVKEIVITPDFFDTYNSPVKFKKDGRLKNGQLPWFYDEAGYPVSFSMGSENNGGVTSDSIIYNSAMKPLFFSYHFTMAGYNRVREYTYTYGQDGRVAEMKAVNRYTGVKGSVTVNYKYSDYVDDENGNWVSRKVEMNAAGSEETPRIQSAVYYETRSIKYYKEKKDTKKK